MKNIIIFVVVVAGGYFAWNNLPGLRDQVSKAANKYGGWTEEARKSDPVGYIEYAIEHLDKDVASFTEAKAGIVGSKKSAEEQLEHYRNEEATSSKFANQIKEQFKTAEETGGWPITINGSSYDKSSAVALVNDLLLTKSNASARMADYQTILSTLDARASELSTRISESKFNKEKLMAQKDLVKVDSLSAEADQLLAKVNELVEGNDKLSEEPATTYEELVNNITKQAKVDEKAAKEAEANSAALDFLNG